MCNCCDIFDLIDSSRQMVYAQYFVTHLSPVEGQNFQSPDVILLNHGRTMDCSGFGQKSCPEACAQLSRQTFIHMLVMAQGGESTASMELTPQLLQGIHQPPNKEIRALGVIHEDLGHDNVPWNAMIIDFHRSTLKCRPALQQPRASKRRLRQQEIVDTNCFRVT